MAISTVRRLALVRGCVPVLMSRIPDAETGLHRRLEYVSFCGSEAELTLPNTTHSHCLHSVRRDGAVPC